MLFKRNSILKSDVALQNEFKKLWKEELQKDVDSRNFSPLYKFADRKRAIRDWCMKYYFNFSDESSPRFKEACDAFDEGDIVWTFLLIREFATIESLSAELKNLTNKRRSFLSEKRKQSVISRHSARWFMHDISQNNTRGAEAFVEGALSDLNLYEEIKAQGKYKSAYRVISLCDKPAEYPVNIKKYLYYVAKRPLTRSNEQQTLDYFKYAEKYFCFKRKKRDGSYVTVKDIDIIIASIAFMRNGGTVDLNALLQDLHRCVKVYCMESSFAPVCILADYLYEIGEVEMESTTLRLLVRYGEAVSEKYKKRYTCLELINKNSNNFIFRHRRLVPLECVEFLQDGIDGAKKLLQDCIREKDVNAWCISVKHEVRTYELNYRFYYDDKILSTLETVLDNEFGDYVLEYAIETYFSEDKAYNSNRSMLIVTSGRNKFTDFPKIGMMLKLEPIAKKCVNVHFCTLYLPDESYTEEDINRDSKYINDVCTGCAGSRFKTFSEMVENLAWSTINNLLSK